MASVASASMSRQHARLDIQGDRAWVSDLGSKNGTYVNEARVERSHALQPGDRVRVGEVTLRLVLAAPPADSGGHAVPGLAVPGLEPTAVRRQPSDLTAGSLDPAHAVQTAQAILGAVASRLPDPRQSPAHRALEHAIITAPDRISVEAKQRLAPLLGRRFS